MNGKYVGYVAGEDPLHAFLSKIMRDPLQVREPQLAFRAFRLSGSNEVYAYEEKLGIDYSGSQWQYADILDWPGKVNRRKPTILLVRNLLSNHDYRQYYLDYMEHMLDTEFNPKAIAAQIGPRSEDGLWYRVRQAAYLESDTPDGRPSTGRRYSNDEVYRSGCRQRELRHGKRR